MFDISVVITTLGNKNYLIRSIKSVINQTMQPKEIIVVYDGEKNSQLDGLEHFFSTDISIKVIYTGKNSGGSFSRNLGIQTASGKWIGLLDDDDEWFPNKLEEQVKLIQKNCITENSNAFVFSSLVTVVDGKEIECLPRKKWARQKNSNIADYLFLPYFGRTGGYIQTSTLFASKKFWINNPFTNFLPKHQDWDWVIRLGKYEDLQVIQSEKILVKFYQSTNSVGKKNRWKNSLTWINQISDIVSKDSFDNFIMVMVIPGILDDFELSFNEKKQLYKDLVEEISIRNKCSFRFLKCTLSYLKVKRLNK